MQTCDLEAQVNQLFGLVVTTHFILFSTAACFLHKVLRNAAYSCQSELCWLCLRTAEFSSQLISHTRALGPGFAFSHLLLVRHGAVGVAQGGSSEVGDAIPGSGVAGTMREPFFPEPTLRVCSHFTWCQLTFAENHPCVSVSMKMKCEP